MSNFLNEEQRKMLVNMLPWKNGVLANDVNCYAPTGMALVKRGLVTARKSAFAALRAPAVYFTLTDQGRALAEQIRKGKA
jgi:hypothetical protein